MIGKRILIVEDDAFIGLDLAEQLERSGFDISGPVPSVRRALELVSQITFDAAVLDVNLGKETSEGVAIELSRRGIPFVICSGYSAEQHPPSLRGHFLLPKPVDVHSLVVHLRRLLNFPA